MRIKELIERQGRSISFEFFPPKTEEDEDRLFEAIAKLETLNPTFVSVTYGAGGGTLKNTRHVVKRIHKETLLTVMPHLFPLLYAESERGGNRNTAQPCPGQRRGRCYASVIKNKGKGGKRWR